MDHPPTVAAPSPRDALARIATGRAVEITLPPALRTQRLTLRRLTLADREAYLGAVGATRADLDHFLPLHREGDTDEQMFQRQVGFAAATSGAPECLRLVGVLDDGRITGGFNLNAISRGLEWKADITWWVAAGLRRQGLAIEGVRALVEHALDNLPRGLGLHAVHAWITPDNAASIRVAQRVALRKADHERSYLQTGSRWSIHECYTRRVGAAGAS